MGEEGWTFDDGPGVVPDTVNGARRLYEVYTRADPSCSGRVVVPTLWDKQTGTIVSNEFVRDHPHVQQRFRRRGGRSLAIICRETFAAKSRS